ncbi:MAG TPA: SpoIIE family protein phosphatase [Chthoniobacteraceae bacterium]|jgi:serine phosphatase RsbU (regulator of sigma subunit)
MRPSQSRLLIADDDQLSRQILTRTLEKAGFSVIGCEGGQEALQILEEQGPMLLVLDYEMPGLNGAEVCARVRSHEDTAIAGLPIIMLTGHTGEEQEVECLQAGANDFVTKPINLPILKARIDTHLRLHTLRTQLEEQNAELERARRNHELDLEAARLTQQAILPIRAPGVAGWDVAAHYQPLIQVGGDMYDWLRLSNGDWLIWMADATGHGASAALLTTLTKLLFRHAASEHTRACDVMQAVNMEFHAIFKGKSFMTAACVVLRPNTGSVHFAGAGHPPLFILRKSGQIASLISQSPPIGILTELPCDQSATELNRGDSVLLYTDGLYSMEDDSGEHLTPADVRSLIPESAISALDLLNQTVNAANARAKLKPLPDDLAAVAMRRV